MLQRTQLMIDRETKEDLLFLSQATNQSMSQLVRSLLKERVKEEKRKIKKTKKVNPIDALLAMARKAEEIEKKYGSEGPSDLSYNIDHYLYGAPKKPSVKKKLQ